MNFRNTVFFTSKGITSNFEPVNIPEIILCGKSNVGKSTFINKLCGNNKLARTGSTPGKTVTVNYYFCDKTVFLVDLPGYGYARRSAQEQVKWDNMMSRYFECQYENRIVLLLVDSRRGLADDDLSLLGYIKKYNLPVFIVMTKTDKLSKTEYREAMDSAAEITARFHPVAVFSTSALNTDDFHIIADKINDYYTEL